jgi:hypothetical protein
MAVGFNQWATAISSSTTTAAISASTVLPTGAYLIVSASGGNSPTSYSISDNGGGTWVTLVPFNATNFATQSWIRTTVGTDSSLIVTVNKNPNTQRCVLVGSYLTGASGSYSSVVTGTGTTAFATVTTPSADADDLYYVVESALKGSTAGTWTATAGAGFTLGGEIQNALAFGPYCGVQYQLATTSGTVSAAFTKTGVASQFTKTHAIVFYQSAGASTATTGAGSIDITGSATVGSRINFTGWGAPL